MVGALVGRDIAVAEVPRVGERAVAARRDTGELHREGRDARRHVRRRGHNGLLVVRIGGRIGGAVGVGAAPGREDEGGREDQAERANHAGSRSKRRAGRPSRPGG